MEQPEYNMFNRAKLEKEYLPLFKDEQMGTTIWSPLASGLLTGKYIDSSPKDTRINLKSYQFLKEAFESENYIERHKKVKLLKALADKVSIPLVNLALCWCLKNKHVSTVILGASKIEQLEENLNSLKYLKSFDADLLEEIENILNNKPI
jgi:aryl-alcohol dehydrogenase-like predicted oxidoreductase